MSSELIKKRSKRAKRARHPPVSLPVESSSLLQGVDNGPVIAVCPYDYVPRGRQPGWGTYLDGFLKMNRSALTALGIEPVIRAGREGSTLELKPSMRAGAVPLFSPLTGQVSGGVIIRPRFGWPSVGRVLSQTGWAAAPELLDLPLVPGSGREVPPWVLAGPVLQRLAILLANLQPGYIVKEEARTQPRGQILWNRYTKESLATGKWHHLPCSFSELEKDPRLRQAIRWTIESVQVELRGVGEEDAISRNLLMLCATLLRELLDVAARRPSRRELDFEYRGAFASEAMREGVRAMGWVANETGLGGGRASEGIAWSLALQELWEHFVGSVLRAEIRLKGGKLSSGSKGETTVPIHWDNTANRAMGHLVPDFVVRRRDTVEIVDAKYKSHFADLDYSHWKSVREEMKDSMRADIHQILAYSAVCGNADRVLARLVYPVTSALFEELEVRGQRVTKAPIHVGNKLITLSLEAASFGAA